MSHTDLWTYPQFTQDCSVSNAAARAKAEAENREVLAAIRQDWRKAKRSYSALLDEFNAFTVRRPIGWWTDPDKYRGAMGEEAYRHIARINAALDVAKAEMTLAEVRDLAITFPLGEDRRADQVRESEAALEASKHRFNCLQRQ